MRYRVSDRIIFPGWVEFNLYNKYLSAYIALLGGADTIVFTGGVGENAPGIRARICQSPNWLGFRLDETRNRSVQVAAGEVVTLKYDETGTGTFGQITVQMDVVYGT